jgi:hypothetical protein
MELHERLVAARKAAGYETAADAAAALGAQYPTYAGHENGSSGFKHKTAAIYARKFGISLEWLLTGRGPMSKKTDDPDLADLIQWWSEAEPEAKAAVRLLLSARKPLAPQEPSSGSRNRRPSSRK